MSSIDVEQRSCPCGSLPYRANMRMMSLNHLVLCQRRSAVFRRRHVQPQTINIHANVLSWDVLATAKGYGRTRACKDPTIECRRPPNVGVHTQGIARSGENIFLANRRRDEVWINYAPPRLRRSSRRLCRFILMFDSRARSASAQRTDFPKMGPPQAS